MDELVNATSGGIGAVVGSVVVYPLDVAKTRMQAASVGSPDSRKTMWQMLLRIVQEDGVVGIMAMLPTIALQQGSSRFTYYYIYAFLLKLYRRLTQAKHVPLLQNLVLGYLAGNVNSLLSSPLETVSTRVVASKSPITLVDAIREIFDKDGIPGFYYAWTTTFYSSANPAIANTIFDQVRGSLLGSRAYLSFFESWLLGAASKATATCITYPPSRIKSMMQNSGGGAGESANASVFQAVRDIHAHEGVVGLYNGLAPTLLKGVLQTAFMLMVKEKIDTFVRNTLFGLLELLAPAGNHFVRMKS